MERTSRCTREGGEDPPPPARQGPQCRDGCCDTGPRDTYPHRRGLAKPLGGRNAGYQDYHHPRMPAMNQGPRPWRLKEMTPGLVGERLMERPTLIVPVGTTEQHG